MGAERVRHPVEMITVGLESERPVRTPANDDVAYALVSRFNVRMVIGKHPRWSHLEGRHLAESDEYESFWLQRLELFERVCIPSVLGLTPRPDAWFIAFGDVESWFVRDLLDRLRPYPWIRPYFRAKGHPDDAGPLRDLLSTFVQSTGKPFLCSTRFDSDDSLHQQFIGGLDRSIALLRERGYPDERRCLNFLYGLLQAGGDLSVFLRRNNMFQSVFESAEDVIGPYAGGHDEVRERMPLMEVVTNLPMWVYHRHEQTLEPSWVTGRDRLVLPNDARYLASFGLDSIESTVEPANDREPGDARVVDRRQSARELRDSVYWNASRLGEAIALAVAGNQAALAEWLNPSATGSADPVRAMTEFEAGDISFLNSAQLARLARALDESGEIGLALRAFDYAVNQSPSDRHLRAERDALADEFASALDIDEQMEIAVLARPIDARSNAVVIVTAASSVEANAEAMVRLRDRTMLLARSGFLVTVLVASAGAQVEPTVSFGDGVAVETLRAESPVRAGSDAEYRAWLRQLANRVSEIGPALLVADGSPIAQRLAAAVGRGLGIPVDFGTAPVEDVEDIGHGRSGVS